MRFSKWSKTNAVFLADIDDEHRTIFEIGEELSHALRVGEPLPQVLEIMLRMIDKTEEHFVHEERLMRGAHYPTFAWHRGQHDTVRKRIKLYAPQLEAGDLNAGLQLVEFLSNWFRDHTGLTDRMMGAYLRNQQRARTS